MEDDGDMCRYCNNDTLHNTWSRIFMATGILTVVTALIQSAIQIYSLRVSVKYEDIPYIWLFIISGWLTLIYVAYTIRLLYLVDCRRCSEISRMWWYSAVSLIILNPCLSIWWWINGDPVLYSVSIPAGLIYISFFILVCRSTTPHKDKYTQKAMHPASIPLKSTEAV